MRLFTYRRYQRYSTPGSQHDDNSHQLEIGEPGDRYEREADAVADRVVMNSSPADGAFVMAPQASGPSVQMKCKECEKEEAVQMKRKDEEELQMKPAIQRSGSGKQVAAPAVSSRITASQGQGSSLPAPVNKEMGTKMGADFSGVKIHTDTRAVQLNEDLGAQAFTTGSDIYFNSGKYNPASRDGKHLLAHELSHVVQQKADTAIQRRIGDGHDLTAARFSGNQTLEGTYDRENTLRVGSRGPAVRLLQQALIDSGFQLPRFGVDGDFGSETKTAVENFQRASGLSAAGVDGVVGPTTMGWLDQRFSSGPTPAGTTPLATAGCSAFKTVTIDFVSLHGSNRNAGTDLDFLNTVFNQACVKFSMGTGVSVGQTDTEAMLGGDTDLNRVHSCSRVSAEEDSMRANATASFGLSSKIRIFYVASMTPALNGVSFPPFCAAGARLPFLFHTFISNSANDRTLAHEVGHQLLDCECHGQVDGNNVMVPNGPGSNLDAGQETTIFSNA